MSLKAADGALAERRRLTKNHVARPMMAAAPTIPPTTPPAIAPTFELVELAGDDVAVEVPVAVPVKEADTVLGEVTEPVDCTLVAVDSGRSPAFCAATGSNPAAVTFRYAQFGTTVPDGMSYGYTWGNIWVQL
jgi:hypothetical protein